MPHRPLPRHLLARLAFGAAAVVTLAACGAGIGTSATSHPGTTNTPADVANVGASAPAGMFTTVDGARIDVASYRGKPTVLWFIATDCSSCTASIPTVANHLNDLRADGVTVAVIDLYGDLGQGPAAAKELAAVDHKLAGARAGDPTWTWGISSRDLSNRYDPFGAPDVYYVLDRTGRITYRNGVPVSTITDLLRQARAAAEA